MESITVLREDGRLIEVVLPEGPVPVADLIGELETVRDLVIHPYQPDSLRVTVDGEDVTSSTSTPIGLPEES